MDVYNQTKWHIYRTFAAIVAIPMLRRLVITPNMGCFTEGYFFEPEKWNADSDFWSRDACSEWDVWPGLRMLTWAASTIPAKKLKDDEVLNVFIPHCRAAEKWIEALVRMKDDDEEKWW